MSPTLRVCQLGRIASGRFQPAGGSACIDFQADRVGVGARPWMTPGLVFEDTTVSPRHAVIECDGDSWAVRDLDSDNGLYEIDPVDLRAEGTLLRPQRRSQVRFTTEVLLSVGSVVLRIQVVRDQAPPTIAAVT